MINFNLGGNPPHQTPVRGEFPPVFAYPESSLFNFDVLPRYDGPRNEATHSHFVTGPMKVTLKSSGHLVRLPLAVAALAALSACGGLRGSEQAMRMNFASAQEQPETVDPERRDQAVAIAKELRARGGRVWCVPFARNVSGIDLQGNAGTWWSKASGRYDRSHTPEVGAVMAFSATRKMPMGHVAVVSEVVSPREIKIDHANWQRNRISLGMTVHDVSKNNDWSRVRVMSQSTVAGSVYPVAGFILKDEG